MHNSVKPAAGRLATALLPLADQRGGTAIEPEPLRPQPVSQLARDQPAGRHAPRRIIHPHRLCAAAAPARERARQAGRGAHAVVQRRRLAGRRSRSNADRERLADLDIVLDNPNERAKELERRTRVLLERS